jgi:hypothetical protein
VKLLAQIDVEDARGGFRQSLQERTDGVARFRRALRERTEADGVRFPRELLPSAVPLQEIPGRRFGDFECRLPVRIHLNVHHSGGDGGIDLKERSIQTQTG